MNLRTATLAAVLVGLLASACSGGDAKPKSLPPVASATATTSVAASVPVAAQGRTSQALDAFVRFYFDQLNVAFSTSDASIIRRLSDPACQTCNNYAMGLDKSRDRLIRGETFAHVDVAAPPVSVTGTVVEVSGVTPLREVVDRSGKVLKKLPADGPFHFQLNVVGNSHGWLVRGIRLAGG